MDQLSVAFGKVILATLGIPIPEDPIEVLEIAKDQTFFIRTTKNQREHIIIHGEDVAAIFDLLYNRDTTPSSPTVYQEGVTVRAEFGNEIKEGKIKQVLYQVDGCGKKHYTADELVLVDEE